MLTVQNTNRVSVLPRISNSFSSNKNNFNTTLLNKSDSVAFTGLRVSQVQLTNDIKELVNLFYTAVKHNVEPNSKIPKFVDNIRRRILTYPFVKVAKQPNSITESIKQGDKLVGGYSITLDRAKSTAHLGFMTLAPDVIKTKTGVDTLFLIGKRICENLEHNNIKEITLTTNSKNVQINNLLKRLDAQKVSQFFSESEYKISVKQFKENLFD